MRIRTGKSRIPRSSPPRRNDPDGPGQGKRSSRLVTPQKCQRRSSIPGLHGILSLLHPELLKDRTPPNRPDKEGHTFPLGYPTNQSVRNAQNAYVSETNSPSTSLRRPLLPCHRCIGVRRGSRTLTGGRNQFQDQQTHPTPHRILLSHVHPHRTQLRHLRERTF